MFKNIKSLFKNKFTFLLIILFIVFIIYLITRSLNIYEGYENSTPPFYKSQIKTNTNPESIDYSNYNTYDNKVIFGFGPLNITNYNQGIGKFTLYYYYTGPPDLAVTYYDRVGTQTQYLKQNTIIDNNNVSINKITLINGNLVNEVTSIPITAGEPPGSTTNIGNTNTGNSDNTEGVSSSNSTSNNGSSVGSGSGSDSYIGSGASLYYNVTNIGNGSALLSPSG